MKGTPSPISNNWEIEEDFLAGPIPEEELQDRMQKLLHSSLPHLSPGQAYNEASYSQEKDPFVLKARQIVLTHLQDPDFSVRDLCRELTISHSQLHRRLTEATGLSAGKFIRSIRLESAKALLRDPELTITAVAYDTGFKDPDYFYRVFKKEFGMTPGEYREGKSWK